MSRIGGKCPLTFSCLTCHLINLLLSGSGQCEREAAQQHSLQHLQSSQYIQLLKKITLLEYIYKISLPLFRFASYLASFCCQYLYTGCPVCPRPCQLRVSPLPACTAKFLCVHTCSWARKCCRRARRWHSGSPEKGLE